MCYLRFSDYQDSNHYAAPLPFNPTVNADTLELVDIAYAPIFGGDDTRTIEDLDEPFPWHQYRRHEYAHSIREADGLASRADLKPLQVIQPEGTSFKLEGRIMQWQKWTFHIGFNFREGIVINDVRYDGRSLFYRLSVSDMVSHCLRPGITQLIVLSYRPYPMAILDTLSIENRHST
jgi:primary-amine oxidase